MGGLTASHPEAKFLLYLLIGNLQGFRLCGTAPPRHSENVIFTSSRLGKEIQIELLSVLSYSLVRGPKVRYMYVSDLDETVLI
jgi:hypothetical protein